MFYTVSLVETPSEKWQKRSGSFFKLSPIGSMTGTELESLVQIGNWAHLVQAVNRASLALTIRLVRMEFEALLVS